MAHKRRRRRPKPGSLEHLAALLWQALLEVEGLLTEEDCPPERVLRAGHCLAQMANAYKAVLEASDLEARLQHLERAAERNGRHEFP